METTGYFTWTLAGPAEPVKVQIRHSVMDWIRDQARSAPQWGTEIGGILMGGKSRQGGAAEIVIEAAEPIECDHHDGPAFRLSSADTKKLDEQVERLKAEGLVPVGCYRTHTRETDGSSHLTLSGEDNDMLQNLLPGANTFLLVRPLSASRLLADLFFWHDGQAARETDFLPFPFGATATDKKVAKPARPAASILAPLAAALSAQRAHIMILAALLAGTSGLAAYSVARHAGPVAAANRLRVARSLPTFELAAVRDKERIVLHWNPELPVFKQAAEASLVIHDGTATQRVMLDRGTLGRGELSYAPVSGAVTFDLEAVNGARGTLTVLDPSSEVPRKVRRRR